MAIGSRQWESVPGFDPHSGKYVPLNLEDWLRDHRIAENGKSRGSQNLPASDVESLDGTENRIIDWVNQRGRNCRDSVANYFSDVERELADMDRDENLDDAARQVREKERDGKRDLEEEADSQGNVMAPKANDLRHYYKDFEAFRQANSLTRPPAYAHRRNSLWWITGAFIFEVAANASLLMEVSSFGLIGSFFQMALISLLNVVLLGMVMGFLLCQFHHIHRGRKVLAMTGMLVLALLVAIPFNLLVGHFRDSMQAVADAPATEFLALGDDALRRFSAAPVGWDSFQSLLLAVLGLAFFVFGGYEWFQRDDRYPNYGQRHRQLKEMQDKYVKAYKQAQGALKEKFQRDEDWLADLRHKIRIKQDKYREMVRRCESVTENYKTNLEQYQHDLNYLLGAWRTANRDARSTPHPSHFNTNATVDPSILRPPNFSPPGDNSPKNREELMEQVHTAVTNLQEHYEAQRKRFKPLDQIVGDVPVA